MSEGGPEFGETHLIEFGQGFLHECLDGDILHGVVEANALPPSRGSILAERTCTVVVFGEGW